MKTSLNNIAHIQTGVFARTVTKGDMVYLQPRHFDEEGQLISDLYPDVEARSVNEKHQLQPGDVLFSAKGTKNFAIIYESKNPPAIASTSFLVIRGLPNLSYQVLPEYVAWFINHPTTQASLKGKARGTSLVSISKKVLEELEIVLPDIQTQKTILKIAQLQKREKDLKQRIEILRDQKIQQILLTKLQ